MENNLSITSWKILRGITGEISQKVLQFRENSHEELEEFWQESLEQNFFTMLERILGRIPE